MKEDLALLLKWFKKFAKFEERGIGSKGQNLRKKGSFNKFEPRQEKIEKKEVQCNECVVVGHLTSDFVNRLNKKMEKVITTTWSGNSNDSGERNELSNDEH